MKRFVLLFVLCSSIQLIAQEYHPEEAYYGSAFWEPDSLGNHRIIVRINEKTDIARAVLPWRRRDSEPEKKGMIIVDANTGKKIDNFYRENINSECGTILFQPQTVPGEYYIYYMPYHSSGGPYPRVNYPRDINRAASAWVAKAQKAIESKQAIPETKLIQFQSRGTFNSFYPMEIVATEAEKEKLLQNYPDKNYLIFPEDRQHPIKMYKQIPFRWTIQGARESFWAEADQNEYFVFQLGIWALHKNMENVKVEFTSLQGNGNNIPASAFTCFNTSGTDWLQRPMDISYRIPENEVRPLWIGLQIPTGIKPGVYKGKITVSAVGTESQSVNINIWISDRILTDHGDSDINRLSRLRWLNSELACNNDIVRPFIPLSVNERTIRCLGRSVKLNEYGLPEAISSYYTEEMTAIGSKATPILQAPFRFILEQNRKIIPWQNKSFRFVQKEQGKTSWESLNKAGNIGIKCEANMEFDGFMEYKITLKAEETTALNDIRLEIPMNAQIAEYWLGMGHIGSVVPNRYEWKWDVRKNQEGFWIGTTNAGLHCVFRDENYIRPLNTNFYHSKPLIIPECWNNRGKGGIKFVRKGKEMLIQTYSGNRTLKKGEEITFIFLTSVTPFKPIDTEKQWHDRYLHSYEPISRVVNEGANTINIHHGTAINPHINYPFFRPDYMKAYIDEAHGKGCKVKIYYTVRELTNRAPEIWALRSLGHEIFSAGPGNGYSWLQEHLEEDYIAAWFVEKYKDAAIVNSGVSRWHNFYVEGLNWLVKNVGIDGLYIDDLAFDRTTMKRIRKILDAGCPEPRIDLHSANQFNEKDGYINSACLYMEHMPYLDRLWLGEYFDYNAGPDYWLTEVSGIPFGMMGEMLQDCGNPWRGMIYGMTSRLHWEGCEIARHIWKAWDNFGIKGSRMVGYWVSSNPVKTNKKDILATTYIKDGKAMIAIASWAKKDCEVKLDIDWKKLGLNAQTAKLYAPEIPQFQPAADFDPNKPIQIPEGKGYLLILETNNNK